MHLNNRQALTAIEDAMSALSGLLTPPTCITGNLAGRLTGALTQTALPKLIRAPSLTELRATPAGMLSLPRRSLICVKPIGSSHRSRKPPVVSSQ